MLPGTSQFVGLSSDWADRGGRGYCGVSGGRRLAFREGRGCCLVVGV